MHVALLGAYFGVLLFVATSSVAVLAAESAGLVEQPISTRLFPWNGGVLGVVSGPSRLRQVACWPDQRDDQRRIDGTVGGCYRVAGLQSRAVHVARHCPGGSRVVVPRRCLRTSPRYSPVARRFGVKVNRWTRGDVPTSYSCQPIARAEMRLDQRLLIT